MLTVSGSAEIIRWVCKSLHPFAIVGNRGFKQLMKTGCPHQYIPSASTVTRDVCRVFARVCQHVADELQVSISYLMLVGTHHLSQAYDGMLHFSTDAWTSPNHHAYVAFNVQYICNAKPISILLDFIKVDSVRTSVSTFESLVLI
jgi:hypothetical protein